MQMAHQEAHKALGISNPNPAVGAVIVSALGDILGAGHTQMAGGPHAEIMAINQALTHGKSLAGSTLYVTLEPCSHQGRTGPCCDAIINAGITKVIAASKDPNPKVAGKGFVSLTSSGIELFIDNSSAQTRELNLGFFSRFERQRPWVRMKIAISLDGHVALTNGASKWITSEEARNDCQELRLRSCAILTGIGTILSDNPQLNVRERSTQRQPEVVILDNQLRTPFNAAVFDAERNVHIFTRSKNSDTLQKKYPKNCIIHHSNSTFKPAVGDTEFLSCETFQAYNELLVEAGPRLNSTMLLAHLVDELVVYTAPKIFGSGKSFANFKEIAELNDAVQLRLINASQIGSDLRTIYRK